MEARDNGEQEMLKQFEKSPRRELRSPPPPSLFPKTIALKDAALTVDDSPTDDVPSEGSPAEEEAFIEQDTVPDSPAKSDSDNEATNEEADRIFPANGEAERIPPANEEAERIPPVNGERAHHGKMLVHSASFFLSPEKLRRAATQRKHSFFDENQVVHCFFFL